MKYMTIRTTVNYGDITISKEALDFESAEENLGKLQRAIEKLIKEEDEFRYMNKEQINKAVAKMNEDVAFDSVKHIYTRKSDGVALQGTSTVSNIIPKPWLSAWGGKSCAKFLGYTDYPDNQDDMAKAVAIWLKICKMENVEDYLALLKEAKGASFRKSKDAMADGTKGHKWLEDYVKEKISGDESILRLPSGMLERPCRQFIKWSNKNVEQWILSEALVASPDQFYAGTMDGMAMMKTGKLAVIDFKFATHISEDAYLQCAGYQNCFERQGIKIDQRIIIRLPKTLEKEHYDKKTHTYSMIPNNLEVKELNDTYEEDRDVFLHCLPMKRWCNKHTKK